MTSGTDALQFLFGGRRLPLQKMRTAVALGSNLGDRLENLRAARRKILDLTNARLPVLSSAIYETAPVDCEPGAAKFLNAVVEFEYEGDPTTLLEQFIRIEEALGRRRDHSKNVSRTIDIDLLYCGDRKIDAEGLKLPHPRMHVRSFVLKPLADIRPNLVLPGQTKTVSKLLAEVTRSDDVVRFADDW
jgi:2-amino-4-hydroxy-6-hydroxymethyldihydropteridine diphosphokinase